MLLFTGFWETFGEDPVVAGTIEYLDADELLERLRARLAAVKPGTQIRIDLIAWDEPPRH
jgi:uncharacterized protein (DUF2126 family)